MSGKSARQEFQWLEKSAARVSNGWKLRAAAMIVLAGIAAGCATGGAATARPFRVEATGTNFVWQFRYAGADGVLNTKDDLCEANNLHVPENARVELSLTSGDYIYLFSIPALNLREVAVPQMRFTLAFDSGAASVFEFKGDELCGLPHAPMRGTMLVESMQELEIQLGGMHPCGD